VTISEAHGLSVERGAYEQVVMTKLENIVPDGEVEHLVRRLEKAARTGIRAMGGFFACRWRQR